MPSITPICPKCGSDNMAEIDQVIGDAMVTTIDDQTGEVLDWQGETEMDWDSQIPVHKPPRFVCHSCYETCTQKQLLRASLKAAEGISFS